MCGLVSIITKNANGFTKEQCDAFDNLLFIDSLRGMDSTGVFLVERDGSMELAKEATPSFLYRTRGEYKALMGQAFRTGRALVGHNRAATKGEVSDINAHPFVVDDRITLVHNGTLYGDFKKLTNKKVDVDSHAIAHKIHECDDDVQAAMQQLDGAFALIWHDYKNNTLNFIRNEQRPLHFVETKDSWIWASESNMIAWILARYNFQPVGEICELTAGVLTTWNFSNNAWSVDSKEVKLEAPRKNYQVSAHHYGGDGYDDYMQGFGKPPVCALPAPEVKPTRTQLSLATTRFTGRTISEENEIAHKLKIDITNSNANADWNKVVSDGQIYRATCVEYSTIKPNSDEFGYWLYATLEKDPQYLIKVYVKADVPEIELMDATLNAKSAMFHIVSRQWRAYQDASHGTGYVLFNADEYDIIEVEEPSPV